MDFGSGSGGLVVRNSSTNVALKNLNGGTFTGLIIADDIEKIHCDIVGAVISMTTSPSGNCIGNGSGSILHSTEALLEASSAAAGGGGGVVSWLE